MESTDRISRLASLRIERVHPADSRARWCVSQYYEELDYRFECGFDPGLSISASEAELVPPRGSFLLATLQENPVACGAVKVIAPGVGSIKRMWVAATSRGLGLGRNMLAAIEDEARTLGVARLRLETNRSLHEAIDLYRRSGYREVTAFNKETYAHHWFEKVLGQAASDP